MLRRFFVMLIVSLPLAAPAASGSWGSYSAGGIVSVGRQALSSRPLVPDLPAGARVHTLSWQITLLGPPPPELTIKLCSSRRCLGLPGLSGLRNTDMAFSGQQPLHFVYYVESTGRLSPPLNVVRNALTLSYR